VAGLNPTGLLERGPPQWRGATLLRQDGVDRSIKYEGKDNRFYRLNAFWVRPTAADRVVAGDQKAFQDQKMYEESLVLDPNTRFWKAGDPLDLLERGEPEAAFSVNDLLRSTADKKLIGLLSLGKHIYRPAEDKPAAVARKTLIVDPNPAPKDAGNKVFKNLTGAFADIGPDEDPDILLRFNGTKELASVRVDKPIKATIKPHPGFHPVVSIETPRDQHSFLIHIVDGDVTLENVEFRVQPNVAPGDSSLKLQAVAGLVGDGRCTFRKCCITLDPAGRGVPVAAVVVRDLEALQMRTEPTMQAAKVPCVLFENCMIRGNGDLIASHAVRPFEADMNNVWLALSGSILNNDVTRDENTPPEQMQSAQLRLKQVTAYLAGHLLRLRAAQFKNMTPVRVDSASCIFQAAGGKSLVHLEGPNPGEELTKTLLQWSAKDNIYGGFDNLVDNQTFDGLMGAPPVGRKEWSTRPGEQNPRILQMAVLTPSGDLIITEAMPKQFKVKSDIAAGQGAVLDDLPRQETDAAPRGDGKTE
jgi:hypothetical protein